MGINKKDIRRQYLQFKTKLSKINSTVYPHIGENDLFDGSPQLYKKYIKKELNYSFNYGSLHFILIDLLYISKNKKELIFWLKKDIKNTKDSSSILIIVNTSFTAIKKEKYKEIHSLFNNYKIKAIFTTNNRFFSEKTIDNNRYINTNCGCFTEETKYKSCHHYYIVNFHKSLEVIGKKN